MLQFFEGTIFSCLTSSSKEAKISTFTVLSVVAKVLNRILLTRLLKAVDEKQREQQAGFRKDRSCTDQIAALQIIIEQSVEHLLISQLCRLRESFW